MSAPAKFLFNVDFAAREEPRQSFTKSALDAVLGEAEIRGQKLGYSRALAETVADTERRTALAVERIGDAFAALAAGLDALERRIEADAAEIAAAAGAKLAGALIAREPFAEIAALAAECFTELIGAPHVVVRVHDSVYETARERLEAIARSRGFDGRLVVLAEPDIAPGDCRVEWADGGISRERARTEAVIAAAVERYIAARRGASPSSEGMSHE